MIELQQKICGNQRNLLEKILFPLISQIYAD